MTIHKKMHSAVSMCTYAFVCLAATASLHAGTINWGGAVNLTGDATVDVRNNGDHHYAYNIGSADVQTLNGVSFGAWSSNTTNWEVLDMASLKVDPLGPGRVTALSSMWFGSTSAPFTGLSAAYQSLLGRFMYVVPNGGAGTTEITLKNLVIGNQYQIQLWINDSRGGTTEDWSVLVDNNAVRVNAGSEAGSLGQTITGTFIADATTQTFNLMPGSGQQNNGVYLNALSLRTLPHIPEPGSFSLFAGVAVLGLALCRYGKRRANATR